MRAACVVDAGLVVTVPAREQRIPADGPTSDQTVTARMDALAVGLLVVGLGNHAADAAVLR